MKKFLALLLFMCVQTAFAQEELKTTTTTTTTTIVKKSTKKVKPKEEDTTLRYDPHSLGISFRIGGAMGKSESYGVYGSVFEFYTQERKGMSQYTPMVGIRISAPISKTNDYTYGGLRWGVLFGGSQYVFDMRSKETSKGWSMLVNGGFTADIPSVKEFIEVTNYPLTLGGELEFKAIYNVHEYVGISFGLHMAYAFGFSAKQLAKDALGDISSIDTSDIKGLLKQIEVEHNFVIGFNFGIIF